jgi:hypothetical protein
MLRLITILLLSICSSAALGQDNGVQVVRSPSTVAYNYYPPGMPPPEVPSGMKGNTHFDLPFHASYNFSESKERSAHGCTFTITITSVVLNLDLALKITLPDGCSDHLRSHEEGHRHIYQYFYDNLAENAARNAGQSVMGKQFSGQGEDCKAAKQAALLQVSESLSVMYRENASDRAQKANDCYDALTNHGRFENVDSMTAADQTIKTLSEGI